MAASFDVNLYINKRVSYREVLAWLDMTEMQYEISETSVIDNWNYENQSTIQFNNIELIDDLLFKDNCSIWNTNTKIFIWIYDVISRKYM